MTSSWIQVDNGSKTNVSGIEVHLKQQVSLSAHGRQRKLQRKWRVASSHSVPAGHACEVGIWKSGPALPVASGGSCNTSSDDLTHKHIAGRLLLGTTPLCLR